MRPHRPGEADDLLRTLALHRQADQQGRQLRGRRLPRHDEIHRRRGFLGGEVLVTRQLQKQVRQHSSSQIYLPSRKLRSIRRPSPVRIDSG
jgi:hypothetical protein